MLGTCRSSTTLQSDDDGSDSDLAFFSLVTYGHAVVYAGLRVYRKSRRLKRLIFELLLITHMLGCPIVGVSLYDNQIRHHR
jgi:hypothetical protein